MRVVLVQCPVWGTREPPLALVQLSACLKSAGHDAFSFDLNNYLYRSRGEDIKNLWAWEQSSFWYQRDEVERFFREQGRVLGDCAAKILARDPAIIGFSVAASTYHATVAFARLLRAKKSALRIVLGGTMFHDERSIRQAFDEASPDYIIRGESDVTFPELVQCLKAGGDVSRCPGIYLKKGNEITFTGARPPIADLDSLPYMDFSDLRIEDYDDTEHISIMSSRGCIWNCAFCSSRYFWEGYRTMSGERIHQEITYQRTLHPRIGHVDFFDLTFNGNAEKVAEFSRLMIEYPPFDPRFGIQWIANTVVSPALTADLLARMKKAGCQRIIFGIESGSPRVLKLMRKLYDPEVAVRVIRDAHAAGIRVTCNFMFGFPGETEEDFEKTLDFVRRIAPYVERLYPSRTYCALEEYSYLHAHAGEFGVRTPFNHHLYWETTDGANTYPVRLDRCRRFEDLCGKLGVRIDCGVRTSVELDTWFSLGMYYEYKQDYDKVLECYDRYLKLDPRNALVIERVRELLPRSGSPRWKEVFREYAL